MPPSAAPDKLTAEIVIPDYCNTGVIFRVLLAVNASILLVCVVRATSLLSGLLNFVEASVLLEWACLSSIFVLCGLRRLLLATGIIHSLAPWAQRSLCALVPMAITGIIISFMLPYEWFRFSYSYLSISEGVLLAGLFGITAQHYFELRARAFSPALVEARLQALQARIRPHFLFNSLNAVLSLIRKEPMRAETALEDLAELFRMSMRDARDMTTLDEEIRLCQQYLSIEKIRLGDRLQVEWDTSGINHAELHSAQIATLMLQPLLENAVNYGVEPVPSPTLIEVRISCSLGTIDITVVNPVNPVHPVADVTKVGAVSPRGNRMALGNIRERLELLYDVEAQLTYGITQGNFEVRMRFPYSKVKS